MAGTGGYATLLVAARMARRRGGTRLMYVADHTIARTRCHAALDGLTAAQKIGAKWDSIWYAATTRMRRRERLLVLERLALSCRIDERSWSALIAGLPLGAAQSFSPRLGGA